jgi:hypothetical protein
MPPEQPPRPGLYQITSAGERWQADKLDDLATTFGADSIIGAARRLPSGRTRFDTIQLADGLRRATDHQFLVEAEFRVEDSFKEALGIAHLRERFGLGFGNLRPDLIVVLPPQRFHRSVTPSGEVRRLPGDDTRLQLRVVDIKLTAEPSPGYFAEVAYYSIALAAWLAHHRMDGEFVVVPDGAVWPGSHEAAQLIITHRTALQEGAVLTRNDLMQAMEGDLELLPFEVFSARVRRFLQHDVPEVLAQAWDEADWHVDNRCKGCDFLGYPWLDREGNRTNDDAHCWPTAERLQDLSRIAFIPRGARSTLREHAVNTVTELAARVAADPVFGNHQALRAGRTVLAGRARSFATQLAEIPDNTGSSASMPRWADLRIYLSVDFDIGSAITVAFGAKAFWVEPRPFGAPQGQRATHGWRPRVFPVDLKSLEREREELFNFLEHLHEILRDARNRNVATTVQIYLWDSVQYEQMTRVIGRHLTALLANGDLRHLAWLFPPEDLLPNPDLAFRRSAITIVRDVVRALLAAPVPHYYNLLETARSYHSEGVPEDVARFSVHPLFEDPLSDQIPSERAHEIWSRDRNIDWADRLQTLRQTVSRRLGALEEVTKRLEDDLGDVLTHRAPTINIAPPQRANRLSADGQLWYAFALLDNALSALETQRIRAMAPHEREARFHSARLRRRLGGDDARNALERYGLTPQRGRRVYQIREGSREVKLRPGDFGFAISPEQRGNLLDLTLFQLTRGTPLERLAQGGNARVRMEDVTKVTVRAIDRDAGLIVLDLNSWHLPTVEALEQEGLLDLSRHLILDPVHINVFTSRLLDALQAIGNPPVARAREAVRRATGQLTGRGANQTPHTPPADFLWEAPAMHAAAVQRDLGPTRAELERCGVSLNPSQWSAWAHALSRRLHLIWGPPGTGKSRTAQAIVLGAALDAYRNGRPIRILVGAANYVAIDNVLLDVRNTLRGLGILPDDAYLLRRLRSYSRPLEERVPEEIDIPVNRRNPEPSAVEVYNRLTANNGISIIGSAPGQIGNLLGMNQGRAQQELFDLILIDEASQMDVAHAIVMLASLAAGGSVILAGDHKQLPPIRQAEPPVGLEAMVGSVYDFCADEHRIEPEMLEINYRSSEALVEFARTAGYQETLTSHSPDLKLHLLQRLPAEAPADWPDWLCWTPAWTSLLEPTAPVVSFVYDEGRSSQWNPFEADAVVALVSLLYGRVAARLEGELDPQGRLLTEGLDRPYTAAEFWGKGVGVVTPHRAQQALIVQRLQRIFGHTPEIASLIREAVDTVERFQGQQRDVMIASFALGDPDAIRDEEEFLLSLNRFNVMASRARAKLIVLVSQQVVDHLSTDLATLRGSALLKGYVDTFCDQAEDLSLAFFRDGVPVEVPGVMKFRSVGED